MGKRGSGSSSGRIPTLVGKEGDRRSGNPPERREPVHLADEAYHAGRPQPVERAVGVALTGHAASIDMLLELYAVETDPEIRESVLEGLFTQGDAAALIKIAREEKDPELRAAAVRFLAMTGSKEATAFMLEILND